MKFTDYFTQKVLEKRPYLQLEWFEKARTNFEKKEIQNDGRIRYWIYIQAYDKYLRVVFEPDNEILHNAFFDRDFFKNKLKT